MPADSAAHRITELTACHNVRPWLAIVISYQVYPLPIQSVMYRRTVLRGTRVPQPFGVFFRCQGGYDVTGSSIFFRRFTPALRPRILAQSQMPTPNPIPA